VFCPSTYYFNISVLTTYGSRPEEPLCTSYTRSLVPNYNDQLVKIQHHLARTIDVNYRQVESRSECLISEDACVIWDFQTQREEAEHLAKTISSSINNSSLTSKDFVILVKQLADSYEPTLKLLTTFWFGMDWCPLLKISVR